MKRDFQYKLEACKPRVCTRGGVGLRAVGVGGRDVLSVMGMCPGGRGPPGGGVAGVVVDVGDGGTHGLCNGDEVYGFGAGVLGSYALTDGRLAAVKPPSWTFDQACAMPTTWVTVCTGFEEHTRLLAGHRLLVHAATGGVGLTAVRYASSTGAEVYATAGRESKHEYLRSSMGISAGRIGSSRDCVASMAWNQEQKLTRK
mgnify:CR=1 FL=1